MQRVEPTMLTRHAVCGRRNWSERRSPQDELTAAEPEQVGQVRMAAGKLLALHGAREIESWYGVDGEMFAEVGLEPGPVERLTDVARLQTSAG